MTAIATVPQITSAPSFSFYVGSRSEQLIKTVAEHADAVTIRGARGPAAISKLRGSGFDAAVLFDREDWKSDPPGQVDLPQWIYAQAAAGADRVLTAGALVPWNAKDPNAGLAIARSEIKRAQRHNATPLLAIDARWLGKDPVALTDTLRSADGPVAIILSDPGDPLAIKDAVQGLRHLAGALPHLTILRADHGAIGALAFGATHAALGLNTTNRHGSVIGRRASSKPGDTTPRVFSMTFADWFTAATIAGWALADPKLLLCHLDCCDGAPLSRFLDEDEAPKVVEHNIRALRFIADLVLDAPAGLQRSTFLEFCRNAASRYDLVGPRGPQDPKPQLTSWTLS